MNLVIDDAIEVKQPTKTDPEESRRSLGTSVYMRFESTIANASQAKSCSRAITYPSSRVCNEFDDTLQKETIGAA